LESGEPGYNKVFITGRVERDEGRKKVAVHIEDGMPTHASDPAHLPISTKGSVRVGSGSSFERDNRFFCKEPKWRVKRSTKIEGTRGFGRVQCAGQIGGNPN